MSLHRLRLGRCNICGKELLVSRIEGSGMTVYSVDDKYYCSKCYKRLLDARAMKEAKEREVQSEGSY